MHGKAAEFVLQVHGDHPLTLVLGCLHVAYEALLLQLRNGKRNGIRADGDVTVLAKVHGFHDLNTVGGEVGGIALLHAERKRLVVSGGHTLIVDVQDYTKFHILGTTRDDAAGECFDKIARVIGMPYPGGAALDQTAKTGDENKYPMPHTKLSGNPLDMSFSGLKTAALNLIHTHEQRGEALDIPSLCASFSKAVSDMLVPRTMQALEQTGYRTLAIAGGVAANSRIRGEFTRRTQALGIRLCMPPLRLCGDNGAMIGAQGYYEYRSGKRAGQDLNAYATMSLENG